jgi:hypothetical protein
LGFIAPILLQACASSILRYEREKTGKRVDFEGKILRRESKR